jgi:hypothetical protein
MAPGSWEDIKQWYGQANVGRYADLAQRMLSLSEELQANPALDGVIPGTSLLELFLLIPEVHSRINIIWDHDDTYRIRINPSATILPSEIYVQRPEVAPQLDVYISTLRSNGGVS